MSISYGNKFLLMENRTIFCIHSNRTQIDIRYNFGRSANKNQMNVCRNGRQHLVSNGFVWGQLPSASPPSPRPAMHHTEIHLCSSGRSEAEVFFGVAKKQIAPRSIFQDSPLFVTILPFPVWKKCGGRWTLIDLSRECIKLDRKIRPASIGLDK